MKNQKLSEEKEARQPQKRSRARKIAGEFVPRVIDREAIKEGATMVRGLWDQLADRQRHLAKKRDSDEAPADFKTLCAENEMGEKELAERKALLLRSRRLSWLFMMCMLVWAVLGVTALILQGLDWFSSVLTLLSVCLSLLFFSWNFRYTLHLWQLERCRLAGARDFFQDQGLLRLFRY